jgi:hypothetical protein
MASKTKHRIIDELLDVRMVLDSSSPSRLLSIGNDWSKLRLAMRLQPRDSGAQIAGTPRFAAGVCSGTAAPWNNGSAATTHFVGLLTNSATWTRVAGPPPYYSIDEIHPCKRVGTTQTVGASSAALARWFSNPEITTNSLYFVDITKGSPDFTLRGFTRINTTASSFSQADFLAAAIVESPTVAQHSFGTARTLAVDEADGALNAVNLAWDRPTGLIEISDLVIVRFA